MSQQPSKSPGKKTTRSTQGRITPPKPPRKSSASRSTKGAGGSQSPLMILILVGVIACLGVVYMVSGQDPLDIFSGDDVNITEVAPPSSSSSGANWEVYFTDPATINDSSNLSGSIPEKLIERIDAAQHSIDIAAFEFNLTPVAEALIAAKKRGVAVRWVTDDEYGLEADEDDDHGQFAMMKKAGIQVVDDGRSALMHNKFIIFDQHVVWTGSTNLSVNDNFRNNNNVIVFESAKIASIYGREFEEMWEGQFGPRSPSTVSSQSTVLDGMPVRILFAPEDKVIDQLIPLVESASQSIRFMAFSFTHDGLEVAMQERAENGVDLKGIFETRASETEYSAMPKLFCVKVPVRQDGNPGTFHHKVIVIDSKIVVTGSLNFSDNADTANDENTVIVYSPEIAQLYLQEFDRRWVEARAPDPAKMNCR